MNYGCRDDVRQFLAQGGISSMVYFPEPIHRQPVFGLADVSLPRTAVAAVTGRLAQWRIGAQREVAR